MSRTPKVLKMSSSSISDLSYGSPLKMTRERWTRHRHWVDERTGNVVHIQFLAETTEETKNQTQN